MTTQPINGRQTRSRKTPAAPRKGDRPESIHPPVPDQVLRRLNSLSQELQLALSVSTTTSLALRGQASERDQEIAVVIDRCYATPLLNAIEDIEQVLREIAPGASTTLIPAAAP